MSKIADILKFILLCNFIICWMIYLNIDSSIHYFRPYLLSKTYDNIPTTHYLSTKSWQEYISNEKFGGNHQGILNQSNYCSLVSEWQSQHPVQLLPSGLPSKESRIIFSDYKSLNLVKTVIKSTSTLVLSIHNLDSDYQTPIEPLHPGISIFFHKSPNWHFRHKIDSHFLCPGQRYNHIPGQDHMVNKDEAADNAREYGEYYKNRPECFDPWKFMPYTYNLADSFQCREFMNTLSHDKDSPNIKWIRKKSRNSHNADGVTIITSKVAQEMLNEYTQKDKCTKKMSKFIVQQYIQSPLLVEGRKFDFRVYMLIASMDPLIILYHDGFLRVSLMDYDPTSDDTMTHVTNTNLVKEAMSEINANDREIYQAMEKQMWTFEVFEKYMIKMDLVEEHWLEEYVRPNMKRNMLHLVRMTVEKMLRHPRVFEMYGVDFMFDSDLHLWFLEVNRSPAMQATTEEKGRIQSKLIEDVLDIEYAILHSADLDSVVKQSGFEWIFDGRKQGMQKYFELIEEECI